jgi:hypothetical protein
MAVFHHEWQGTQQELISITLAIYETIHEENFPEIDDTTFNKLMTETICRNIVIAEIIDMINHLLDRD